MEIYLDANATTPVLAQARQAALAAMAEDFGNPSSIHSTGLKARALMDAVRQRAQRLLGTGRGKLLFLSGATEGIQTSVLSALSALRDRRALGDRSAELLLYGATEHNAVPEALKHWNQLLGLNLEIRAIPVGRDGRHDLALLREWAPRAGLVCTMVANNETGVISDLDGIEAALGASTCFWMVDGVQGLGKLNLNLAARRIDYAPFSGHKLYAPKGIGLLYVRESAPFTPLMAGGGQEGSLRSGTENMSGIAALGAVLAALDDGRSFRDSATLERFRARLAEALLQAFPNLVFNAPLDLSLPTTLNFSVPGLSSKLLLDLFDAADVRVSGGSACSAAKAQPSFVLQAMGLPDWQTASAVRMSFGPAVDEAFIDEACARLRACGAALRDSCLAPGGAPAELGDGVTRYVLDGACCWLLCDRDSRRALVIDALPGLAERLAQQLQCQGLQLLAVLDTQGDRAEGAAALWAEAVQAGVPMAAINRAQPRDALGWPEGVTELQLGSRRVQRLALPGHRADACAYLLRNAAGEVLLAWVGDALMPGALGRSDLPQSAPLLFLASLQQLAEAVGPHALLLPGHDPENRFATTLSAEVAAQPLLAAALKGELDAAGFAARKAEQEQGLGLVEQPALPPVRALELDPAALQRLLAGAPQALVIDVREPYEQRLSQTPAFCATLRQPLAAVPLSRLVDALPAWLALPAETPLVFFCRSGNRSAQASAALRRLGHEAAYTLAGGLALWPGREGADAIDAALYV